MTPKGMQKNIKHDLWQYALSKEKEQIIMRVFSPVLCKDSFRIIMVFMAHYDLEIHQMDVKTTFLNGDLYENDYMAQPKRFCRGRKEHMGCRLQKSIYGLKVCLQTLVLKLMKTIRKFRFFKENQKDNSVYTTFKNGKFIFHILLIDDILLTSSDVNLTLKKKKFCPQISM